MAGAETIVMSCFWLILALAVALLLDWLLWGFFREIFWPKRQR